jgi:glycosyltransferase involved in cell wall biosynthesis
MSDLINGPPEEILSFTTFDPTKIKWQYRVLWEQANIWHRDGDGTVQTVLYSGAVGSAKTTLAAVQAVLHCLNYKRAKCLLGRRSLPDLRDTIYSDIVDLLDADDQLIEGIDYTTYDNVCRIIFHKTKSEIFARTWGDKRYKKFRSLKLSLAIIEEATENGEEDRQAIREIMQRLNRIGHIKANALILLTNPDSPAHWIHRDIIQRAHEDDIHVYYSLTADNPFLDSGYISYLQKNLTKKEADRQLRGMWVEIDSSRIYYAYDSEKHFKRDTTYQLSTKYPVDLMMDFNVSANKPMSWALGQHIGDTFHVFKEYHAFTMRTGQLLEEMAEDGAFELPVKWRVYGDASGKNNDTRSLRSDYEIVEDYLARYRRKNQTMLEYSMEIPRKNPPLRRRHNTVNGVMENEAGDIRFQLYKGCELVDEGFRLTEPKKGSHTIENDDLQQQHVTTAIAYWIDFVINLGSRSTRSAMRIK